VNSALTEFSEVRAETLRHSYVALITDLSIFALIISLQLSPDHPGWDSEQVHLPRFVKL
jgi:hypothetical protein